MQTLSDFLRNTALRVIVVVQQMSAAKLQVLSKSL